MAFRTSARTATTTGSPTGASSIAPPASVAAIRWVAVAARIVSQTVFVCLTYSLLQLHLLHQGHQELNRRTWPTSRRLLPDGERVIVYRQQYFGFFTLLEHTELTLSLEGKARRRALAKARRLRQESALSPISSPRP